MTARVSLSVRVLRRRARTRDDGKSESFCTSVEARLSTCTNVCMRAVHDKTNERVCADPTFVKTLLDSAIDSLKVGLIDDNMRVGTCGRK
jgi:hypothetical protein